MNKFINQPRLFRPDALERFEQIIVRFSNSFFLIKRQRIRVFYLNLADDFTPDKTLRVLELLVEEKKVRKEERGGVMKFWYFLDSI